jgi:hypothetical protein
MKLSAMGILGVVVTAVALAVVPSASAADSIAWGTPVNGFRLGAAFGSDPAKPILRVVFQNVGPAVEQIVVGHEIGKDPSYDTMKFIATAPDGKQIECLHKGVYIPVGGLVLPISVTLNGAVTEIDIPLKDIIYASRTTTTLDVLVKQGYSVRVQFEATQGDANWAKLSRPWIGTLTSAEIKPAR